MTTELSVLGLAGLLQFVQYVLMAVPVNLEVGTDKTLSSRDPDAMGGSLVSQVSARTARLIRALDNHFEALILFTIAVVVVEFGGAANVLTGLCAWLYLCARILYIPAYAFDWVPWRSLIWMVGFTATLVMLVTGLAAGG